MLTPAGDKGTPAKDIKQQDAKQPLFDVQLIMTQCEAKDKVSAHSCYRFDTTGSKIKTDFDVKSHFETYWK